MITCCQLVEEALLEISFVKEVESLYGAKVSFSTDKAVTWKACKVYLGHTADALLDCSVDDWNDAVEFGNIKFFDGEPRTVYWNLFLDHLHQYEDPVRIRVELLTKEGLVKIEEVEVFLRPSKAIFLNNWEQWLPEEKGWKICKEDMLAGGYVTVEQKGKKLSPLQIRPQIRGRYAVSFGIPFGPFRAQLKMNDEHNHYPFANLDDINSWLYYRKLKRKTQKEVSWKEVDLKPESVLEIGLTTQMVRAPEVYPFGRLSYIKLVPTFKKTMLRNALWKDKRLALYFEPYSWAFCYGLKERWQVKEAISLLKEMGADEIHTQVLRFGSKAIHWSSVVERESGKTMGDDQTYSSGPEEMVRSLDVLRESIALCKEMGIIHYTNAGLTNCYPGTATEERISRDYPQWRRRSFLLFRFNEIRKYAAAVIKEFIKWRTDGISIDCMRYPYYQTEEDLVALFRAFNASITNVKSSEQRIPLTVRIPAGDIIYFKAFERLVKEKVIQCIIPSTDGIEKPFVSLKPYLKWKDYGCKLYGRVDGSPESIRRDTNRYFKEGADGIFVYQSDAHLTNPFTRPILNWWKK